ncbi:AAA family ATPase [Frankia sp. CN7]|nr:AAA family ATPase [Frankia nepalensis]MBL7513984.1 AAA family ATPase [Frankia nepalensis]
MLASGGGTAAREAFVGRHEALRTLRDAFATADGGTPVTLLVEGPAGIGKTSLVARFIAETAPPCVLRASGEEDETSLAFGVLDQVLAAVPAAVPATAAGRGRGRAGGADVDPLVVGAELVDLIGEAQTAGVVVLLVEDLHWADRPSLRALAFALRRLRHDRVLTVLTTRDVESPQLTDGLRRLLTAPDAPWLRLTGLDADDVRALQTALGGEPLSGRAADRLRAHAEGNPLHLRALLAQVPAAALNDLGAPLPAPRSYAPLIAARLAQGGTDLAGLVGAAAVLGPHCPLPLAGALAGLADPLPALERAVQADLLAELPDHAIGFPHPLTHAAAYQQLGPAARAALHTRAAALVDDPAVRLRHLVRAASGPDPALSAELAAAGRRQAGAGSWTAAADQLSAAARLAARRAERERLTLEATECLVLAGELADQEAMVDTLRGFGENGWRSYVLGRIALTAGRHADAAALLDDAWRLVVADGAAPPADGQEPTVGAGGQELDRDLAARIAGQLAQLNASIINPLEAYRWARLALRLAPPERTLDDMLHFMPLNSLGRLGRAEEALVQVADLPGPAQASVVDLDRLLARAELRLTTDDLAGARADLVGLLAAARDRSATFRIYGTQMLALAEFRAGHWDDAVVHVDLALTLAVDTDQGNLANYGRMLATSMYAARGDWAATEGLMRAAAAEESVDAIRDAFGVVSIAHARGDGTTVAQTLIPLLGAGSYLDDPGVLIWMYEVLDGLSALGDLNRASELLVPFEQLATRRRRRQAMACAARARAAIEAARDNRAGAEAAYQAGLAHLDGLDMPFEEALLRLGYGALLRRSGRRRAAAEQLSAAHEILDRLGAAPYLERCARELAACGLRPHARGYADADLLTPQELAVARRAVRLSNREIARELFISVKTVEFHLRNVYAKLAVTSRAQLPDRLGAEP